MLESEKKCQIKTPNLIQPIGIDPNLMDSKQKILPDYASVTKQSQLFDPWCDPENPRVIQFQVRFLRETPSFNQYKAGSFPFMNFMVYFLL